MMHRTNRLFWTANLLVLALGFFLLAFIEKGQVILFFSDNRQPFWNIFFRLVTHLAESFGYILLFILLLFVQFRAAFSLFIVAFGSLLTSWVLKTSFAHPRPWAFFARQNRSAELVLVPDVELHMAIDTSFPSGHTISAFALFTVVALAVKPLWLKYLCLLAAVLVGLSRIYLVQHFLEDVCVGALVGSALGYGIFVTQKIYLRAPFFDRKL